jgi:hypothetical protein
MAYRLSVSWLLVDLCLICFWTSVVFLFSSASSSDYYCKLEEDCLLRFANFKVTNDEMLNAILLLGDLSTMMNSFST